MPCTTASSETVPVAPLAPVTVTSIGYEPCFGRVGRRGGDVDGRVGAGVDCDRLSLGLGRGRGGDLPALGRGRVERERLLDGGVVGDGQVVRERRSRVAAQRGEVGRQADPVVDDCRRRRRSMSAADRPPGLASWPVTVMRVLARGRVGRDGELEVGGGSGVGLRRDRVDHEPTAAHRGGPAVRQAPTSRFTTSGVALTTARLELDVRSGLGLDRGVRGGDDQRGVGVRRRGRSERRDRDRGGGERRRLARPQRSGPSDKGTWDVCTISGGCRAVHQWPVSGR